MWGTESRQSRGYGLAWEKVRKQAMQRDCGLCQVCKMAGTTTIAQAVDHIVSKAKARHMGWTAERMDGMSNLQSICNPCHERKTIEEQGKRARGPMVGADGWPAA